jgi:anionic cell wall polymer biosynthesis LytR-Cps2A-Psr (LCP) family protein
MQRRRLIGGIAAGIALVLILTGIGLLVARVVQSRDDVPLAAPPTPANSSTPWGPITGSPAATTAPPGSDLNGPLDLLIVGIDTRVTIPDWQPHADAIMLMHVPAGLDKGYLLSLPRDLLVDVPAFPKANFRGGRMKLTEAMSRGSRVPGRSKADVRQGYELLSRTIAGYTGIKDFDAGAVLTFTGLSRLTDALGGVTLKIDQKVVSQHIRPDGRHRAARAGGGGYVGPQMVYRPGTRRLVGWQAVDYARQRYTAGGDYTRQRHQRQLIKALLTEATVAGLATDPEKLDAALRALGDTLVFEGKGRTPAAFAHGLRDLRPAGLTMVGLPGDSVGSGNGYRGEQLLQAGRDFLKAVAGDRVEAYLRAHPNLINKG